MKISPVEIIEQLLYRKYSEYPLILGNKEQQKEFFEYRYANEFTEEKPGFHCPYWEKYENRYLRAHGNLWSRKIS